MAALLNWDRGGSASLFERIQGKSSRSSSSGAQALDLVNSIKRHLSKVLNARPGESQSSMMLGVIDLNDATMGTADLNSKVKNAIETCIVTYEPRITSVFVEAGSNTDDPLTLYFTVTVNVLLDEEEETLAFNIQLDSNRHYRLD